VKILDQSEKELRNKKIYLVKVLWRSSQIEEETWEKGGRDEEEVP